MELGVLVIVTIKDAVVILQAYWLTALAITFICPSLLAHVGCHFGHRVMVMVCNAIAVRNVSPQLVPVMVLIAACITNGSDQYGRSPHATECVLFEVGWHTLVNGHLMERTYS